jgi:hypothetical protein
MSRSRNKLKRHPRPGGRGRCAARLAHQLFDRPQNMVCSCSLRHGSWVGLQPARPTAFWNSTTLFEWDRGVVPSRRRWMREDAGCSVCFVSADPGQMGSRGISGRAFDGGVMDLTPPSPPPLRSRDAAVQTSGEKAGESAQPPCQQLINHLQFQRDWPSPPAPCLRGLPIWLELRQS